MKDEISTKMILRTEQSKLASMHNPWYVFQRSSLRRLFQISEWPDEENFQKHKEGTNKCGGNEGQKHTKIKTKTRARGERKVEAGTQWNKRNHRMKLVCMRYINHQLVNFKYWLHKPQSWPLKTQSRPEIWDQLGMEDLIGGTKGACLLFSFGIPDSNTAPQRCTDFAEKTMQIASGGHVFSNFEYNFIHCGWYRNLLTAIGLACGMRQRRGYALLIGRVAPTGIITRGVQEWSLVDYLVSIYQTLSEFMFSCDVQFAPWAAAKQRLSSCVWWRRIVNSFPRLVGKCHRVDVACQNHVFVRSRLFYPSQLCLNDTVLQFNNICSRSLKSKNEYRAMRVMSQFPYGDDLLLPMTFFVSQ